MATSLALGAFSTPFVERLVNRLKGVLQKDPLGAIVIVAFLVDRLLQHRRLQRIDKALDDKSFAVVPDAKSKAKA